MDLKQYVTYCMSIRFKKWLTIRSKIFQIFPEMNGNKVSPGFHIGKELRNLATLSGQSVQQIW